MGTINNYFRSFTDLFPKGNFFSGIRVAIRDYFSIFLFVYFALMILVLCVVLLLSYSFYTGVRGLNKTEQDQLVYWEAVITDYPNYPDAYYNAAYFAARIGDDRRALQYVESALYLDGNFNEAKRLKEEILEL